MIDLVKIYDYLINIVDEVIIYEINFLFEDEE